MQVEEEDNKQDFIIDASLFITKEDHKNRAGIYLNFEAAKVYMSKTHLRTKSEWEAWCKSGKRPSFIPRRPDEYYEQYTTLEDFLGKKYFSYEEAVEWVKENLKGVDTQEKWKEIKSTLPPKMPKDPQAYYKGTGWKNWYAFFGKELPPRRTNKKKFLDYLEAQKWVKENLIPIGINSAPKFFAYKELPPFIPSNPQKTYEGKGWTKWGDFFGTDFKTKEIYTKKEYRSYEESKKWVQTILKPRGITTYNKWLRYLKNPGKNPLPKDIPASIYYIYKRTGEWVSCEDFFGTAEGNETEPKIIIEEEIAEDIIIEEVKQEDEEELEVLELKTEEKEKIKVETKIEETLEKKKSTSIVILSYEEAKKYIKEVLAPKGVSSPHKYAKWVKARMLPKCLPKNPHTFYKSKGWISDEDFFGLKE